MVASHVPLLGTRPATQACALTGNQTRNPLVCRPALNALSHTSHIQPGLKSFKKKKKAWVLKVTATPLRRTAGKRINIHILNHSTCPPHRLEPPHSHPRSQRPHSQTDATPVICTDALAVTLNTSTLLVLSRAGLPH